MAKSFAYFRPPPQKPRHSGCCEGYWIEAYSVSSAWRQLFQTRDAPAIDRYRQIAIDSLTPILNPSILPPLSLMHHRYNSVKQPTSRKRSNHCKKHSVNFLVVLVTLPQLKHPRAGRGARPSEPGCEWLRRQDGRSSKASLPQPCQPQRGC